MKSDGLSSSECVALRSSADQSVSCSGVVVFVTCYLRSNHSDDDDDNDDDEDDDGGYPKISRIISSFGPSSS